MYDDFDMFGKKIFFNKKNAYKQSWRGTHTFSRLNEGEGRELRSLTIIKEKSKSRGIYGSGWLTGLGGD